MHGFPFGTPGRRAARGTRAVFGGGGGAVCRRGASRLTFHDAAQASTPSPGRLHVGEPFLHALARPRQPFVHGERPSGRVHSHGRLAIVVIVEERALLPAADACESRCEPRGQPLPGSGCRAGLECLPCLPCPALPALPALNCGAGDGEGATLATRAWPHHAVVRSKRRRNLCQNPTASCASGVGWQSSSERLKRETSLKGSTMPCVSGTAS